MNPTWSWTIILLICFWTLFASVILKIILLYSERTLVSSFISLLGLYLVFSEQSTDLTELVEVASPLLSEEPVKQ
jgi:hypothetical protein